MLRRALTLGLVALFGLTVGCGGSSTEGNGGNGQSPQGGVAPPPPRPPKAPAPNA